MAKAWSELHPFNMRAAIGTEYDANSLRDVDGMTYHFGDQVTKDYVVALDGHFRCASPCGASMFGADGSAANSTTTMPASVPVATMVFTVAMTPGKGGGSFAVASHEVDMTRLGKVYSLDAYS